MKINKHNENPKILIFCKLLRSDNHLSCFLKFIDDEFAGVFVMNYELVAYNNFIIWFQCLVLLYSVDNALVYKQT